MFKRLRAAMVLASVLSLAAVGHVTADPAHNPGGPCIQDDQNVSLASVSGYDDVVKRLDQIEGSSGGLVEVFSAGQSGEGRELLYATVGEGEDVFWLQARIHGNELLSSDAALHMLKYLSGGSPDAKQIRDALTVVVIPMYNPDGAEANIRQSTTPFRLDLNRDWELFRQPESRAFYELWEEFQPRLALDMHHMGSAPRVEDTDDLNQFQIGGRSISPTRMTDEQWETNRRMAMVSVDALEEFGPANIAHYPLIDITNAVISRMLLGGPGPDGSDPGFMTQGAIFYEVRSVGQKSNGQLENMFKIPAMALLRAAADGSLYSYDFSGYSSLPFATGGACGEDF
ncbi:MAG: M14 family zinc carboxypeptidase [Actinomycetota bacterium]